jgi:hypothetical protein
MSETPDQALRAEKACLEGFRSAITSFVFGSQCTVRDSRTTEGIMESVGLNISIPMYNSSIHCNQSSNVLPRPIAPGLSAKT